MRKKIIKLKDYKAYSDNQYDEMKKFIGISRTLLEQTLDKEEQDTDKEEMTKEESVSGGKIIIHGTTEQELNISSEETGAFQETMDEFLEQVSDLVDYGPLNIYKNNIEWSGKLVQYDLDFFYVLGERNGLYIDTKMLKLDEELMETLTKLKTYYEMFTSKWAKILAQRKTTEPTEIGSDEMEGDFEEEL